MSVISDGDVAAAEDLLPDHLREGWRCYRDWWVARYRSGNPLPAGGVFLLNRRAVLMDELFRLHLEVAHGLKVPFEAVRVDLEVDPLGRPVPTVDVKPPEGWCPDVAKRVIMESKHTPESFATVYVRSFVSEKYRAMQERLTKRVIGLASSRPELTQEVVRGFFDDPTGGAGDAG